MTTADFLGNNSYPAIVNEIHEKIKTASCATQSGNDLCVKLYANMNESTTPIMELRKFSAIVGTEETDDDVLQEIVEFCQQRIMDGDYNFVINLAKEEHLDNLKKLNHPNPEETIKNFVDKFDAPSEAILKYIEHGVFNSLQSKLYKKLLVDLGIELTNPDIELLGDESYPAILNEIYSKIQKAKCETNVGEEIRMNLFKRLNESITPLHEIKAFVTGAEKIAGDDTTICDIVKFCNTKLGSSDLNYIINLCKEEHFANLSRANHPSPQSTVEAIEKQFNKPSSVIEAGIKSGIFDGLQSKLLNKVKVNLSEQKPLNESEQFNGQLLGDNLIKYNPVGIKLELEDSNRVVFLTESFVLGYDDTTEGFENLNESEIEIPTEHKSLMLAINSLPFDPENNTFSLNENWDFDLQLNSATDTVTVNGKKLPKDKVRNILLESVKVYEGNKSLVPGFSRMKYLRDADNFIALCENTESLIKFDQLDVIKNLNENTYVVFDTNVVEKKPSVLISNAIEPNKLFESYDDMIAECNKSLSPAENLMNSKVLHNLFESQIINEQKLLNTRNSKIVSLTESQSELNLKLKKVIDLKSIAEPGSPALKKLYEQEETLSKLYNENLETLNSYKNNFKLYQ